MFRHQLPSSSEGHTRGRRSEEDTMNPIQFIYFVIWKHCVWSSPLQITKKQCCWSGALRLGFTSKDPSRINPDNLPKYACPDLVSQSGFWAKALPEEFANEGNIIAFWVDKKGRVFYRINESSPMLFFSGVRTAEPLWALIDVYGLTRGVQLLGKMLNGARGARVSNQPSNRVKSPWDQSLRGPNFINRER